MERKNKAWVCKECGKPTKEPDKVCMICKTDDTQVVGLVNKKAVEK